MIPTAFGLAIDHAGRRRFVYQDHFYNGSRRKLVGVMRRIRRSRAILYRKPWHIHDRHRLGTTTSR
jgi:hypothetical protein